jgi:hypothetical protein
MLVANCEWGRSLPSAQPCGSGLVLWTPTRTSFDAFFPEAAVGDRTPTPVWYRPHSLWGLCELRLPLAVV